MKKTVLFVFFIYGLSVHSQNVSIQDSSGTYFLVNPSTGAKTPFMANVSGQNGKVLSTNGTRFTFITASGTGSVTDVSVASANGFAGSVATSSSTPAITLSTSVTGLLKGDGTGISAAVAGTDFLTPSGNGSALTGLTGSQISGNIAGSAATLTTPRTLNGVSFNGSEDITVYPDYLAYAALGSPILAETVNFPLGMCNTAVSLTDNQLKLQSVYLTKSATLTGIKVYMRTSGNYTGDNNNRVGLYSYSGGTLTLVASSANNSTLWTAANNGILTIPFSSTYAASSGLYYVAVMYNQSAQTTAPQIAGPIAINNLVMQSTAYGFANSAKLNGTVAAQNDLPATQAMTGVTSATSVIYVALY